MQQVLARAEEEGVNPFDATQATQLLPASCMRDPAPSLLPAAEAEEATELQRHAQRGMDQLAFDAMNNVLAQLMASRPVPTDPWHLHRPGCVL